VPKVDMSVDDINNRYSSINQYRYLLNHFNSISVKGSVREYFLNLIQSNSKMKTVFLIIENSTSGEVYSYRGIAFGKNGNGKYYKLDFQYYSGSVECKINRIKDYKEVLNLIEFFNLNEYDSLKEISFPSDLIILSYIGDYNKWNFRISPKPIEKLVHLFSVKH